MVEGIREWGKGSVEYRYSQATLADSRYSIRVFMMFRQTVIINTIYLLPDYDNSIFHQPSSIVCSFE
jgi:hypothetical protein